MSYESKIYISWEDFYKDSITLCKKIEEKYERDYFKGIVVVTRGGLATSSVISSYFDIKNVETFPIYSYNSGTEQENAINIIKYPEEALKDSGEKWLVIDDLVDTGKSADLIKKTLPNCVLVALYSKIENPNNLDLYSKLFNKKDWLCFPWSFYTF